MSVTLPFGPKWSAVSLLAALLVVSAVVFGGASQRNDLALALVELTAVPLLCVALYRIFSSGAWRENKGLLALTAAVIAVPILQLIPLPPEIWTGLTGREQAVVALQLLGQEPGWTPLSLTPDATRAALWALVPPVAMVLAITTMDASSRLSIAAILVAGAVASILLAGAQLASGGEALYLYSHSRAGEFNGFSANRNHIATLVLMGLPIAAAVGAGLFGPRSARENVGRWIFALYAVLAVIAIGLTRSRTGIVLVGPVLIVSLLLMWQATRRGGSLWKMLGFAAIAALGVATVAAFGLAPILDRFESARESGDLRFEAWPAIIHAGNSVQPWGAGLGAFDPVFRSFEPLSDLGPRFWNRAHNDYLELWLEAGLIGTVLTGLVLVWAAQAWVLSWRGSSERELPVLARAAGVCVLVVALHSVVDYPLRTETIAVFLAFCFGCLTPPAASRRTLR